MGAPGGTPPEPLSPFKHVFMAVSAPPAAWSDVAWSGRGVPVVGQDYCLRCVSVVERDGLTHAEFALVPVAREGA